VNFSTGYKTQINWGLYENEALPYFPHYQYHPHLDMIRTPFNPDLNPHKTRIAVRSAVSPDDELCTQLIVLTCFDLHRDKVKVTCVSWAGGRKLDRIHNA
jgi:hypothetical protein